MPHYTGAISLEPCAGTVSGYGLLRLIKWNPHHEMGFTGARLVADITLMLRHNAVNGVESKAGSLAHTFRGEERLKDPRLQFGWNARTIVYYFDYGTASLASRANVELSVSVHGINCVRNQIRPDLIEFAAVHADDRNCTVIIANHFDAMFQPVAQHDQRVLQSSVKVYLLLGHLVHVRVFLHRANEFGDLANAAFDFFDQPADRE